MNRIHTLHWTLIPLVSALAGAVGCGARATPVGSAQGVSVSIFPPSAQVRPSGTVSFNATVSGSANTSVVWSVQEANGGSISAAGAYTAPQTLGAFHVVATSVADPGKSGTATVTVAPPPQPGSWVIGFWNAYSHNWSTDPVIDTSAMTHLGIAHLLTQPDGTLTYGYGLSQLATGNNDRVVPGTATDLLRSQMLVAIANAGGVMPIISIGGSDDPNFRAATSDANRAAFVSSLVAYLNATGFQGVDIDWETNFTAADYPQMVALSQAITAARPGTFISWDLNNWGAGAQAAALAPYVDQLNVMTYDMGGTGTWCHSALYGTAANGATGWSADRGIMSVLNAGVSPSKVGIGTPFYGYDYPGAFTAPGQGSGARSMANYNVIAANLLNPAFQYTFDSGMLCPTLTDGATHWFGYEDEEAIRQKALYARSKGLGGVIIFVPPEADFGQVSPGDTTGKVFRNPLLDAVKRHFLGRKPNPAPRAGALTRFAATASSSGTVNVSGLGRSAVSFAVSTYSFISGGSGTTLDTIFDRTIAGPTHGVPVDYDIDVYRTGAWVNSVVHVTGNNLSDRMHVVDLTNATQVRMRVSTVDAAYAGFIDLVVHDLAKGSDDSLIVLGDSNSAAVQCGTGSGEAGRLGYEVNQRDSTRWPIVIPGGTSQATMASFLDTATYGIPRIRYWLQQLPVKYVALQIGSNDVNGWSQPATTQQLDAAQASMEQLIKEALAQGRTVILPRLRWMDGSNGAFPGGVHPSETANIEAWHARLDALLAKYPSVMAGPDVYTPSKDRPDLLSGDGVHPNQAGVNQSMGVWVDWMMANVYTTP